MNKEFEVQGGGGVGIPHCLLSRALDYNFCTPLIYYFASGRLWLLCVVLLSSPFFMASYMKPGMGVFSLLAGCGLLVAQPYPALACFSPDLATAVKRCQPSHL